MLQFPLKVQAVDGTKYEVQVWSGQHLGSEISCDTETNIAPFHTRDHRLIVFQAYGGGPTIYLVRKRSLQRFFNVHNKSRLIFHNAPFDIGVLMHEVPHDLLLSYYDRNLIFDTKLLWQLFNLASIGTIPGVSSLLHCCQTLLGINIDKNHSVRTSFDQFMGLEYEEMTEEHAGYAALDVVYTYNLYCKLLALIQPHDKMGTLLSHHIQVKGDLALNDIYKNGLLIDMDAKKTLVKKLDFEVIAIADRLAMWGIIRGRKGIKDQFERVMDRLGILKELPLTESGIVSSKSSDLEPYKYIQFVDDYLSLGEKEKLGNFLANLNTNRIHPKYNTLLKTGRVSCTGGDDAVNIMQYPKDDVMRSIFIPKPGKVLYDIDISGLENVTLAQVLVNKYGHSRLADTLNAGKDVHRYYASILFNKDEDLVTKQERQQAKAAVFGFPGGLGIDTFITFAKGYRVHLTREDAQAMKDKYFQAFPEMRKYLAECDDGDVFTITGRKRANATYCAVANTPFQGLGADVAKIALYDLLKIDVTLVAFIHDAFICEENNDELRYKEVCDTIIKAGNKICPDIVMGVSGFMCDRWRC